MDTDRRRRHGIGVRDTFRGRQDLDRALVHRRSFSPTGILTMSARLRRSRPNGTYPSMLTGWSIHTSMEQPPTRRPIPLSAAASWLCCARCIRRALWM
jgi:hypothetical protein